MNSSRSGCGIRCHLRHRCHSCAYCGCWLSNAARLLRFHGSPFSLWRKMKTLPRNALLCATSLGLFACGSDVQPTSNDDALVFRSAADSKTHFADGDVDLSSFKNASAADMAAFKSWYLRVHTQQDYDTHARYAGLLRQSAPYNDIAADQLIARAHMHRNFRFGTTAPRSETSSRTFRRTATSTTISC